MATVSVGNIFELKGALAGAAAGTTIKLASKTFIVNQPLLVPDGVSLVGAGTAATRQRTVIKADPALAGDIVTLRDGASLRRLIVEDVADRSGNLVAVTSAMPGDHVRAAINGCKLVNPNRSNIGATGPVGRAVLVTTLNPIVSPPAPHAGSTLIVVLRDSVIESTANGSGVFAINFAPQSRIFLELTKNTIGGGLDTNGGVSRPFPVEGSEVIIVSRNNLYRSDGSTPATLGWFVHGGSNAPAPIFDAPYTNSNALLLKSESDTIKGFQFGLYAAGGWRPLPSSGPANFNRVVLQLKSLKIESLVADMVLLGAESPDQAVPPGDGNRLLVAIDGFTGSGARSNFYADAATGDLEGLADPGTGNHLELIGDSTATLLAGQLNPAPPASFYFESLPPPPPFL